MVDGEWAVVRLAYRSSDASKTHCKKMKRTFAGLAIKASGSPQVPRFRRGLGSRLWLG